MGKEPGRKESVKERAFTGNLEITLGKGGNRD